MSKVKHRIPWVLVGRMSPVVVVLIIAFLSIVFLQG